MARSNRTKRSQWTIGKEMPVVEPFNDVFTTILSDTVQNGTVTASNLLQGLAGSRIFTLKSFEVELATKSSSATTGFTSDARFQLGVNIDGDSSQYVPITQPVVLNSTNRTVIRLSAKDVPPRILGPYLSGATTPVMEIRSQGLQAGETMTVQLRTLAGVYPRSI